MHLDALGILCPGDGAERAVKFSGTKDEFVSLMSNGKLDSGWGWDRLPD